MTDLEKNSTSFTLLLKTQAFAQLVKTKLKRQIAGALSFVTDDFVELLAEVRTELKCLNFIKQGNGYLRT